MKPIRIWFLLTITLVLGLLLGAWLRGGLSPAAGPGEDNATAAGEPEIEYWVAPMDPNYRRDGPGKSPMGMDLVPVYRQDPGARSADSIRISSVVQQNLGLKTASASLEPLSQTLLAPAVVAADNDRISHVHVKAAGWVRELLVSGPGQLVEAGEPVLRLYSPALLEAQREYLSASRRAQSGLLTAAQSKLELLGMQAADLARLKESGELLHSVAVSAPAAGQISALNTASGMYVGPADVVMSITDLSRVWLLVDVPATRSGQVATGQQVTVRDPQQPRRQRQGRIERLYPELDPATRSLRARLSLDNTDGRLRPGQYLQASMDVGDDEARLSVPVDAVIHDGVNSRVVLALPEGRFRVAEVETGIETDQRVEILRGLEAGDRVVVAAQFLIDSEASLRGAQRRLEPADARAHDSMEQRHD